MTPNYPTPFRSYLDYPYNEYELQGGTPSRKYYANPSNKNDAFNHPIYASSVPSPIVSYVPANIMSYAPNISLSSPYNSLSHFGYKYSGQQYVPFQRNPEYSFHQLRNDNNRPINYSQERSNCPRKYSNSVYGDINDISSDSSVGSPKANTPSPKPARYRGKPNKCVISEIPSAGDVSTEHKLSRHHYTSSTASNRYSIADTDSLQCSEVSLYTNNTSILDDGDETEGKHAESLNEVSIPSSVTSNNKEEYSSNSLARNEKTIKKQVSEAPSRPMLIGPGGQLFSPEKYAKRFQRAKSITQEKEVKNNQSCLRQNEEPLNYSACESEPNSNDEREADPSTLALPSDIIMSSKDQRTSPSSADSFRLPEDECVMNCQTEHNINHGKTPKACDTTRIDEVESISKSDSSVISPSICSTSDIKPDSIVAKCNEESFISHGDKSETQNNITNSHSHLNQSGSSVLSLSKGTLLKRSSSTNSVTTKLGGIFNKEKRVSSDSASAKSNSSTHSISSAKVLSRIRSMTQKNPGHSTNLDTLLPSPYQDLLNKSRKKRWMPGIQKKSFVVANSIRVSDGKSMGAGSNSTEISSDAPAPDNEDGEVMEEIHDSEELHDSSPENSLKQVHSNCTSNEMLHPPTKSNSSVVLRSAMKKVTVKPRIQRSGALSKPSVSFSENVQEHPVYSFKEYDRSESEESAGKRTTLQTLIYSHPRVEYEICKEINAFKRTMTVHPLSRQNTQFMKVSLRNIDQ